ncbi:hypothetical protein VTK73DRAFT_7565 [Phialemonium thermophilum]|uniref:Tat pathway signal sequence n=1 Tax=Phialemonium thermophilum TaxID=223376 RepID=A0ABR3WDW9_9PEZI
MDRNGVHKEPAAQSPQLQTICTGFCSSVKMTSETTTSYHKLVPRASTSSDPGEEHAFVISEDTQPRLKRRRGRGRLWIVVALLSIVLNIVLLALVAGHRVHPLFWLSPTRQGRLYSPAQHVLRRVDRVFDSSFPGGLTPYQGPPDEANNKLWEDLYNVVGISRISTEEAQPLVNRTLPIPGDHGHYMVSLSVFHQLHCLNLLLTRGVVVENLLRKVVYGHAVDWANQDELYAIEHLDHCVDIIRQCLQCNADITPITFVWSDERQRALEEARMIHTCADFEAIHAWGVDHRMKVPFDFYAKVADDPLGWGAGV